MSGEVVQDADDLDTVRRYFGIAKADLIGHSYMGLMLGVHAEKYPDHVNRAVQIGPMQPNASTKYPAHLTGADAVLSSVLAQLSEFQKQPRSPDPQQACEKFWSILRPLYVVDPADAEKINWGRCELPNERNALKYFNASILPSLQALHFSTAELAHITAPIMIIHGTRDRSSPYGGGIDWATFFPNARLITVQNAAHAPWIEAPGLVFDSINTFLAGKWPEASQHITKVSDRPPPLLAPR